MAGTLDMELYAAKRRVAHLRHCNFYLIKHHLRIAHKCFAYRLQLVMLEDAFLEHGPWNSTKHGGENTDRCNRYVTAYGCVRAMPTFKKHARGQKVEV